MSGARVALVFPPLTKASEPSLGVATLKSFLNAHDVPCRVFDANVEGQRYLLERPRIDEAHARLAAAERPRDRRFLRAWASIGPSVERFIDELRSSVAWSSPERHRTAIKGLNLAFGTAAAAHDLDRPGVRASLSDYLDDRCCDMSSRSVVDHCRDPERNLFYTYYRDVLLPQLAAYQPKVVGISLIFRNQLLCGLALARLLAREMPDVHVVLGGELVSAWTAFLEDTALPEAADSILPYEGELGLLALARELAQPEPDLGRVPNLCWRDARGGYHKNPTRKVSHLRELPPPDFSDSPWELYLSPVRIAPMVTARGCYWNRCTFCPEVINPESRLRLAPVDRLLADMEAIHRQTGARWFHFIDSAIPPRTLRGLSAGIRERGLPFHWYGFSRLEPTLTRENYADRLADGGCVMLKLGLETANQYLLDQMDKNQDIDDMSRVLRSLRDAGILVHGMLMFGTPRETREHAEETLEFLRAHADCVQFLNLALMNLARGSPMAADPPAHGITEVIPFEIEGHTLDLALYDNFRGVGWGRLEARRFLHRTFLKDPLVRAAQQRTPALYDANHSPFFHPRAQL